MATTPQDILTDAYSKSKANQPGRIATESTELLGVVNRAVRVFFSIAARINPLFYGDDADVAYGAPGWARPTNAEAIYRIEDDGGDEIVVVPFDDLKGEVLKPAVYRFGQVYIGAGNTNDPTSGTLTFYFSRTPVDCVALDSTIDSAFPENFMELPIHEVAIYLALKDERAAEVQELKASRDSWLRLYLAFLEHETLNERRRFGHLTPFNVPSIVPVASLLQGGSD